MDASFSPHTASSHHAGAQSEAKRRKVRKGTFSCWECKRRKMRCILDLRTDATCKGCRRRGSKCVSQEFSEEEICEERTPMTPNEDGTSAEHGIPTPASLTLETLRPSEFYKTSDHRTFKNRYDRLSRLLHESLPSRKDLEQLCEATRHCSILTLEISTVPYAVLEQTGLKTSESLLAIPGPTLHPVLIARYMLQLATFLQHLHPDVLKDMNYLSESPRVMMERIAGIAIRLVTTNEELLGSIEGLECVMIETVYQANVGNVRRSWVACRRAMGIAQMMGLHRSDSRTQYQVLDPNSKYHPQHMWFRVIDLERYLCLILGLPQGCLDRSMTSDAMYKSDTPMGRLERVHCVVASRILERNESNTSSLDYDLTRTVDLDLQKAARSLPARWWLTPNLAIASKNPQSLFWETRRLFLQVLHHNLLNQLHLPYMLRTSPLERKFEYSRITCVNASREMLSRFISLRSFNRIAYNCRTIDFLTLMAAMTLLLAHLDRQNSETENPLAHQYLSDRAMIEQAQENMQEVNRLSSDALSAQSADLLGRLLALEVETAEVAGRVSVHEAGTVLTPPSHDEDAVVSVHIPYFGVIKIAREGVSREVAKSQRFSAPQTHLLPPGPSEVAMSVDAGCNNIEPPSVTCDINANSIPHFPNDLSFPFVSNEEYPGLAAGTEDWAFQGVDMAFFESLMRGAGKEGIEVADWTAAGSGYGFP